MCNCLIELEKAMKATYKDPDAEVNWTAVFDKNGRTQVLPKITTMYRKTKKNGEREKRESQVTIIPTFCPFCGKRYELKREPKSANPKVDKTARTE